MNQELLERRLFMLNTYGKFFDIGLTITGTAQKFNVRKGTVRVDWHRRSNWIKQVAGFDKKETVIYQMLVDLNRIMKELTILKYQADNDNAKVGATRLEVEIRFKIIQLMRDLHHENPHEVDEIQISWIDPIAVLEKQYWNQMTDEERKILTRAKEVRQKYSTLDRLDEEALSAMEVKT